MNDRQTVEGFFYEERDQMTRIAAKSILTCVRGEVCQFDSVLDVGCGVGTWLSVASELGASVCEGIEGPWVRTGSHLVVDSDTITVANLESEWSLARKYDLGICLEVAEHLSTEAGDRLVETLANHCDAVLFSAAIPGQGGNGHINEQWPRYWQERFRRYNREAIDLVRPLFFEDEEIPWWYRQNTVVFVKRKLLEKYVNQISSDPLSRSLPLLPLRLTPHTVGASSGRNSNAPHSSLAGTRKRLIRWLSSRMRG